MINFAFCYEHDEIRNFVRDEVLKCFNQKGIIVAVMCYRSAYELQRCVSCNCPDVLFYDIEAENGLMRKVAMNAKRQNEKLISITTHSHGYHPHTEDVLLEPMFILPDRSRRHIWSHAVLAYETFLDDRDSFSYYVRPDYIHIPVENIRYFASEGRRTHVVSAKHRDTFYQKLDIVEALIQKKNCHFLRIHKSYLVNAKYIAGYNRDYVFLTTGEQLRISKYKYYKYINGLMRENRMKRQPLYSEY